MSTVEKGEAWEISDGLFLLCYLWVQGIFFYNGNDSKNRKATFYNVSRCVTRNFARSRMKDWADNGLVRTSATWAVARRCWTTQFFVLL